ncbi:MAG: TonB-dependent receptor [Flavobacteriaceae bacterium]|nr:TonB-dependent receptor [Flavobacteriaceae bacterium]
MDNKLLKVKLTLLLLTISFVNWAQTIEGKVFDKESNPLEFAAVAVINPADSILISYASVDKNGKFILKNVTEGKRIFQVNFIGYKTYQKIITFNNKPMNMGVIILEGANELDEVIVNVITPITVKKDTVAYNTKAFKVRVDDTVEDLLKKLPGVEVDASGKITAQGEEVTKIYVDGKEFFSGDPTIATKNLSADAIKSVELIDEKSEKSRVSGVNDSERVKVINLKLKDDRKVNDFGKFQGGYGTDDRYLGSLNYNRFSKKLQTSIIGKMNNVNTSGSDISEIMVFNTGGGRAFFSGSPTPNSGFVTTGVGGLNLGYEIEKDQNLNADYFYNYTNTTTGDVISTRTEFIGDIEILSEGKRRSENTNNRHSLNFNYRDRSNKLSSLYIDGGANLSANNGNSINTLDKFNGDGELDLQSIGLTDNKSNNANGNIRYDFTKRFNDKSKRHITSKGGFNSSKSSSTSNNNQLNKFSISDPDDTYEIKQDIKREQDLDNLGLNLNINYIEPITEKHLIDIGVGVNYKTIDDDVNQTKLENDVVQNPLIYTQYYDITDLSGGVKYKYDNDKFTFSIGASILNQNQKFGLTNDLGFNNSYTNILPTVRVRYRPKRGKFMRFSLNRSIDLPSLNQVTPVINDFNPLFILQGNPNLTPEDRYSLSAIYINHNFATGFSLFTRISYDYTSNTIVNSEFTDISTNIRYSSFENLGDRNNFNIRTNFSNRIKSWGLRYSIRVSGTYSEYMSIINFENNETQSKDGTLGLSLENNKKDKIDAMIGANWTQNYTTFTTGNNADRDFLQQSYYVKSDWNVTDRFNLNSQFKFDIYSDSNFGANQVVPIWNASISYAMLKSKSLTVMLSALDILNKNIGIERNSSDNYFEEIQKDVLGNYYMLSLTYNLNGNKNPNAKGRSSGHRIRRGH